MGIVIALVAIIIIGRMVYINAQYNDKMDLGNRYLNSQDYEQAILAFEAAIDIDPRRPEAYVGLAQVYVEQERYRDAVDILQEGMEATGEDDTVKSELERVRELYFNATLTGIIMGYDGTSNPPALEGASVTLECMETGLAGSSATTDSSGSFSMKAAPEECRITISASGYKPLEIIQTIYSGEERYLERVLLLDESETGSGTAYGTLSNALTGEGEPDATLRLREGWGNRTGDYVDGSWTTGSYGDYTISDVPTGYYTLEAQKEGFITGYTNILVTNNQIDSWEFALSPELADDEVRIILTWGYTPRDLDSHLEDNDGDFHVYFGNRDYDDGNLWVNLDVDDTSSYGPETVTISGPMDGTYTYYVYDYTNGYDTDSTELSYSGATVRVFRGNMEMLEFHVPVGQAGTTWTVFTIDENYNVIPINTME